jgi:hypothetical protein
MHDCPVGGRGRSVLSIPFHAALRFPPPGFPVLALVVCRRVAQFFFAIGG